MAAASVSLSVWMLMLFLLPAWKKVQSEESPPPSCANTSRTLLVLPGLGWNALENKAKARVIDVRYEGCHVRNDLYLLPDGVGFEPVSSSRVPLFSELFDGWPTYRSVPARRLNDQKSVSPLGAPTSIEGSFSSDVQSAKRRMVQENAVIARIYARHHLFTLHVGHATHLSDDLAERLQEADAEFERHNVENARSILEHVVADYGTHYTTEVDVGAMVVEENDVRRNFLLDHRANVSNITKAASAMFLRMIDFRQNDDSYSSASAAEWLKLYVDNRLDSFVETFGGPPLKSNMSLDTWAKGVPLSPGGIGQRGMPLVYAVSAAHLPSMSYKSLRRLQRELRNVIDKYYLFNTHVGCTDVYFVNFEYSANIGDASCGQTPSSPVAFGGIYQNCIVKSGEDICAMLSLDVRNVMTGGYTCPFWSAKQTLLDDPAEGYRCRRVCNETACYEGCYQLLVIWCNGTGVSSSSSPGSFGGVYSTVVANPMTGQRACPTSYAAVLVGEQLSVCIATSRPNQTSYAIPFGGFFSFDMSNRTAKMQSCPIGFSRHTADILDPPRGTVGPKVIVYCARFRDFPTKTPPPLLAPLFQGISTVYTHPTTGPSSSEWSAGAIAAIVLGICLLLLVLVVVVGCFLIIRSRRLARQSGHPTERSPLLSSPRGETTTERSESVE